MIINTQTVAVTLFVIGVAFYIGIGIIRRFALTIAQENLNANLALDAEENASQIRRGRDADAAASAAFAKVEPMLTGQGP
jgi:hypothetical protein